MVIGVGWRLKFAGIAMLKMEMFDPGLGVWVVLDWMLPSGDSRQ